MMEYFLIDFRAADLEFVLEALSLLWRRDLKLLDLHVSSSFLILSVFFDRFFFVNFCEKSIKPGLIMIWEPSESHFGSILIEMFFWLSRSDNRLRLVTLYLPLSSASEFARGKLSYCSVQKFANSFSYACCRFFFFGSSDLVFGAN